MHAMHAWVGSANGRKNLPLLCTMCNSSGIELTATHVQFDSVAQGTACHDDPAQPVAMLELHGEWRCMLAPSARSACEPNGSAAIRFTVNCIYITDVRMHHSWQLTPQLRGGKLSRRAAIRLPNLQICCRIDFGCEKFGKFEMRICKKQSPCTKHHFIFLKWGQSLRKCKVAAKNAGGQHAKREKCQEKIHTLTKTRRKGFEPITLFISAIRRTFLRTKAKGGSQFRETTRLAKRKIVREEPERTPLQMAMLSMLCIGVDPHTFVSSGVAQFDTSNTLQIPQISHGLTVAQSTCQL
eukprot:jgi/Bigna1/89468/estExt_fgenesh1_pg.C_500002